MRILRSGFYIYFTVVILVVAYLALIILKNFAYEKDLYNGDNAYRLGDYGDAEIYYTKIRTANTTSAKLAFRFANTLHQQGRYKEAISYFEKAVLLEDLSSLKAQIYYNSGINYFKINQLEKSITAFKEALLLAPNDNQTRLNLLYLLQMKASAAKKEKDTKQSGKQESAADKKAKQDGDKAEDEEAADASMTETMLDMVSKEEQSKKAKIGKMKRKLNNLSKEEKDY